MSDISYSNNMPWMGQGEQGPLKRIPESPLCSSSRGTAPSSQGSQAPMSREVGVPDRPGVEQSVSRWQAAILTAWRLLCLGPVAGLRQDQERVIREMPPEMRVYVCMCANWDDAGCGDHNGGSHCWVCWSFP